MQPWSQISRRGTVPNLQAPVPTRTVQRARSPVKLVALGACTLMPDTLPSKVIIRRAAPRDETRWRELFDGYCLFYKRTPSELLARHTWTRIMDDASPIHAIVSEDKKGSVIGIANYVVHEHTLGLTPACYLGDLFVDPAQRAAGVGEQLIGWLVAETKREGWSRLYWHTRLNNYRARGYMTSSRRIATSFATPCIRKRETSERHVKIDEEQIRELVSKWMAATKPGDIEVILSLMTDDVVFLVPGRPAMRKSEFAAASSAQASGSAPKFDGTSDIQEIEIAGDWAFMWSWLKVVATTPDGGGPTTRTGHTLSVFRRQEGRWLLARDANLLGPPQQASS